MEVPSLYINMMISSEKQKTLFELLVQVLLFLHPDFTTVIVFLSSAIGFRYQVLYQVGVFLSRSSVLIFQTRFYWVMSLLQVLTEAIGSVYPL